MLSSADFCDHLGLTVAELARRTGVSGSLASRVELGRESAYPGFRRGAAEALHVPEAILWSAYAGVRPEYVRERD